MKIWPFPSFLIYSAPIELVHLQGDGFHILSEVVLNKIRFTMLIDTGASKTVLDKMEALNRFPDLVVQQETEHSTGLGTNSMESYTTQIGNLSLGNLYLKNLEIALLDLSHIREAYESMGLLPIFGVIGNDILVKYSAIIDYHRKQIRFRKPD